MNTQYALAGYQGRLPRLRVIDPKVDAEMVKILRTRLARANAQIMELQAEVAELAAVRRPSTTPAQVLRRSTDKMCLLCDDRIKEILAQVVQFTGVSRALICGAGRHQPLVRARALFAAIAQAAGYSSVQIGLALGFRDPSTIGKLLPRGRVMLAAIGGAL